ncbi:MAG TPA: YceI family protein, partial [Candidatus Berkiella sp.]|nr:YceI family protein [Candidatus Berkiella sp.]
NAPVKGSFKTVSGTIDFSPDDLKQSKINIAVEMSSVNASYQELVSTLKMSDWLDVAKFKEATFTSKEVTKIKDNTYQAKGELQIRDKKLPLTVDFTVDDYKKDKFHVKGETKIKRTAFGVG